MSWTRLDDLFTEQRAWDDVPHEARWHYLAVVQACSRQERWDGRIPLTLARRASDVADPDKCHEQLAEAGWVRVDEKSVTVVRIDDYVPPPYMRDAERKEAQRLRKQRERAHKAGEHSMCLPENCPDAPVTPHVTRDTGTGRDGYMP